MGKRLLFISVLTLTICFLVVSFAAASEVDTCKALISELDVKKRHLNDYTGLVKNLRDERDAPLVNLLKYKIRELDDQIARMESEIAECRKTVLEKESQALNEIEKKTCSQLRNMLLQLIRKSSSLKRRENSLFSDLSVAEKTELDKFTKELDQVREALKNKCKDSTPARSPFRATPR